MRLTSTGGIGTALAGTGCDTAAGGGSACDDDVGEAETEWDVTMGGPADFDARWVKYLYSSEAENKDAADNTANRPYDWRELAEAEALIRVFLGNKCLTHVLAEPSTVFFRRRSLLRMRAKIPVVGK